MLSRRYLDVFCALFLFLTSCSKQVPPAAPTTPSEPQPHPHQEVAIPTPLMELQEAPLDLLPFCDGGSSCSVLILYANRLELRDWKTATSKEFRLMRSNAIRSRAPSGKLIRSGSDYWVLNNNDPEPLCYSQSLTPCLNVVPPVNLPRAAAGLNYFSLFDGKFYDLELSAPQKMAVIETTHHLSVADSGRRLTSQEEVGGSLAANWPVFYTSAPVLEAPDSILKFAIEQDTLVFKTDLAIVGQILDLTISDLNQDGHPELLATVKSENRIFVQVHDAF